MQLFAVVRLKALFACAQRNRPVAAHLGIFIKGFHRLIIESIFGIGIFAGPNQGFMSIGKASSLKVRHRIGLVPDNVV